MIDFGELVFFLFLRNFFVVFSEVLETLFAKLNNEIIIILNRSNLFPKMGKHETFRAIFVKKEI